MSVGDYKALVSIGVPAYNGEKYLKECLDSIINQSYSNWECVISNNYSTDKTAEIAEEYVQADSRFRLIHTEELLPITKNWNFCYSHINKESKFFKLLPADDWITPDFIEEMVNVFHKYPEVGICSSIRLVGNILRGEGLDFYAGNRFNGKEILISQLRQKLNLTSSVNSVLYRREALKQLEYYPAIFQEEPFHQDTFLSFELLQNSDLGFVFKILSYTRRHEDSVTSKVTSKLNTRIYFWEFVLFHYRSLDQDLEEEYKKIRIRYADFFLISIIKSRKNALAWHRKRLIRPIKIKEYVNAVRYRVLLKKI